MVAWDMSLMEILNITVQLKKKKPICMALHKAVVQENDLKKQY